jgi:hypothetical protein
MGHEYVYVVGLRAHASGVLIMQTNKMSAETRPATTLVIATL